MSTIDIAALMGQNSAEKARPSGEKPSAEFWLNVGYNSQNGFVTLPYNLALDTMPKRKAASGEYGQKIAASNQLHDVLLEAAKQLQPGQSASIKLEVQLYRNKAVETAPAASTSVPDLGFTLIPTT